MLTKSDLSQIQKVIQVETTRIVQSETRKIVQEETANIIQRELDPVKKDIKNIKMNVRKVKKTVDVMARIFDREDIRLRKRVTRIEEHLGFSAPQ